MEWIGDVIGTVVIAGAAVTAAAAWLTGFLNQLLPSPARTRLALTNFFRARPPRREDGFRIVLCWLEEDPNGASTRNVARAFTGLDGIGLVRSARMLTASGAGDAWRPAMQESARAVLQHWDADLAVVGLVKKPGEVLTLWFVPRLGEGTLRRGDHSYTLENVTLGSDFHNDLREEITATALATVAPLADNEARSQVAQKGLTDASRKISRLLAGNTVGKGNRRAALQAALGNALFALGEREGGTGRLEKAVAAHRSALEESTREHSPLAWAGTQNNLGTVLATLGEREGDTKRLEEAVTAYRSALKEYTRERVPLQWATTQNNLGAALFALGEREDGAARFKEAVSAHRNALQELTRERVPLDWAMAQNNLGNALSALGRREDSTARLEEAVAAYRSALKEYTRERVPLHWAMTQYNLGTALFTLGEREDSTARFKEAVSAHRSALKELTREHVPLHWARTQHNLGHALSALGEREDSTARLKEAVAAYRNALKELTRERAPLDWAKTQHNLGDALMKLGEREGRTEYFEEAVAAYGGALEVFDAGAMPRYREHARTRRDQARQKLRQRRAAPG